MTARLTFLGIVAFWLTMNVLLWRAEFGAHGGDTPVPVQLVYPESRLVAPKVRAFIDHATPRLRAALQG